MSEHPDIYPSLFPHFTSLGSVCCRDLVPIISALEYNTWFTKLKASHVKLPHEAIDRILHILKKNLTIEELYLDNLQVKW